MPRTARIAAVLAFAVVCVPAHALSMKDYEAKSDADKLHYLQTCIGNLTIEVAKTDRALALRIKSYYTDKAPGRPYPQGTYDLIGRIVRLEQQAETDRSVDLSKIEVEEVVARTTAEKFKTPAPPDFQRSAAPRVAPRPAAPAPAPQPAAPVYDPIGQGGFITPPDSPQKPAYDPIGTGGFITPPTATAVQLCVPADLVPSWENPAAGNEMEVFRQLVAHYVAVQGKVGELFRIRNNAFDTFERARRAQSPSTPLPGSLVDFVRAGQRCPATDHLYNVQSKSPPAPQK
jgi:hypothetical protein